VSATLYRVYVTPLISLGLYGSEVEITDWVTGAGCSAVTRAIDSSDYDVGIFTFDDVTLQCDGSDGYLADPSDSRALFQYRRDLAKVRIVYSNDEGTATTTFRGYIFDEGTRVDLDTDTITFQILSRDSVLRKTKVPAGTVGSSISFSTAIVNILNGAGVAGYLTINASNINVGYNGTVDDGSKFDDKTVDEALDSLCLVSNSVLYLDDSDNVIVKSRWQSDNPVLYLYGKGNLEGKENILSIGKYNTGLQRCFNSIRITGGQPSTTVSGTSVSQPAAVVEVHDADSIALYGLRQKELTVEFLTTAASLAGVANALLLEFRYPKIELEVKVSTELLDAQSPPTTIFDQVSIDYPLQVTVRPPGKFLPVAGNFLAGDTQALLPQVSGAVVIDPSIAFKVISISEDPTDFTSVLKLRQVGVSLIDGVFNVPLSVVTKTANYQMTTSDDVVLVDASSGAVTVTLPDPTLQPKKQYMLKKIDASVNGVTINPYGLEQIEANGAGAGITLLSKGEVIKFITDGANWQTFDHSLVQWAAGDVPYASATNTPAKLPKGTDSYGFELASGVPSWQPREKRNAIHNGAMDFWFEATSFATIADSTETAERFKYRKAGTSAVHTVSRSTDVPTLAQSGFQSSYSILIDNTTADAVVAAGDFVGLEHRIEGYDWAQLKNRTVTLNFWVKATKTGTYCIAFRNNGSDRSYIAEYTVSAADTWEEKNVTVTLNPSGGTDDFTNGVGLSIMFTLMCGSTFQIGAGSWQSGDYRGSSNQVNACDSTSNNFYLTQVQLTVGSVAPDVFSRAGGTIERELNICRRYFQKSYQLSVAPGTISAPGQWGARMPTNAGTSVSIQFVPTMRAAPTITAYSPSTANAPDKVRDSSAGADVTATYGNISESSGNVTFTPGSAAAQCFFQWVAQARL
jgi:hypothetical protein